MNSQELTSAMQQTLSRQKVNQLTAIAIRDDLDINILLRLTFHPEHKIAFRSSWILENVCLTAPEKFEECYEEFINRFPEQMNTSAMRHFTKILIFLTGKNRRDQLNRQRLNMSRLIEILFSWLIDPKIPVAVKANCAEALVNLIPGHEWIRAELSETINHLTGTESIAFFSRAKKLKGRLKD